MDSKTEIKNEVNSHQKDEVKCVLDAGDEAMDVQLSVMTNHNEETNTESKNEMEKPVINVENEIKSALDTSDEVLETETTNMHNSIVKNEVCNDINNASSKEEQKDTQIDEVKKALDTGDEAMDVQLSVMTNHNEKTNTESKNEMEKPTINVENEIKSALDTSDEVLETETTNMHNSIVNHVPNNASSKEEQKDTQKDEVKDALDTGDDAMDLQLSVMTNHNEKTNTESKNEMEKPTIQKDEVKCALDTGDEAMDVQLSVMTDHDEETNTVSKNENEMIDTENHGSVSSVVSISDDEQNLFMNDDNSYDHNGVPPYIILDVQNDRDTEDGRPMVIIDSLDLCDTSSDEEYPINKKHGRNSKDEDSDEEVAKKKCKPGLSDVVIALDARLNCLDLVMDETVNTITIRKAEPSLVFGISIKLKETNRVDAEIMEEENASLECKETQPTTSDDNIKLLKDETDSKINMSVACEVVQSVSSDENKLSNEETDLVDEEITKKTNTSVSKSVQPVSGDESNKLPNETDHDDTEIMNEVKASSEFRDAQHIPSDENIELPNKETDRVDREVMEDTNVSLQFNNEQLIAGDESMKLPNYKTADDDTEIQEVNSSLEFKEV